MRSCILLLLDGLGDRTYKKLGQKTPLQAAKTPNLDKLSEIGANGLFHASIKGQALPSEEAHSRMFGYAADEFPGRGCLEAMGAGISLESNHVAILGHFVCVRKTQNSIILVKDRPPHVALDTVSRLISCIPTTEYMGLRLDYIPTKGLDGIVRIKGDASPLITDTDPLLEESPVIEPEPLWHAKNLRKAQRTAVALRRFILEAFDALSKHPENIKRQANGLLPLNCIVTNRAGQLRHVEPFRERWGLEGVSISSGIVYHGLMRFLGMEYVPVKDTGDPARDIRERLKMAIALSNRFQFIHCHTKVPDEAAHTKDPMRKMQVIEAIDKGIGEVMPEILSFLEKGTFIITSDHSTPSKGPLIHSGETVPLMAIGKNVRIDNVRRFNEIDAAHGGLGEIRGEEFMHLVLNWLDMAKLHGLMDTPFGQPFWPGKRRFLDPSKREK